MTTRTKLGALQYIVDNQNDIAHLRTDFQLNAASTEEKIMPYAYRKVFLSVVSGGLHDKMHTFALTLPYAGLYRYSAVNAA